jgi:hypothetical protein
MPTNDENFLLKTQVNQNNITTAEEPQYPQFPAT